MNCEYCGVDEKHHGADCDTAHLRAIIDAVRKERDEAVGRYEVRDADADCLSVKLDNALNEINRLKAQNI